MGSPLTLNADSILLIMEHVSPGENQVKRNAQSQEWDSLVMHSHQVCVFSMEQNPFSSANKSPVRSLRGAMMPML